MKAPIPEKIDLYYICDNEYGENTVKHTLSKDKVLKVFNYFIDVLTEQQKENKTLTQRVSKLEKKNKQIEAVLEAHGNDLFIIRNSEPKPYTAMRSTGKSATEVVEAIKRHNELEYCVCEKSMVNTNIEGESTCVKCLKPIKPQENVREKIKDLIKWHQFWKGNDILTEDLADRILAIVKGE